MAKECRIKCKVRPGAFDDELIARFEIVDSDGRDTEAECWAYGDSVELQVPPSAGQEVDGALHAYSLEQKEQLIAVVLPQSTFQNGPNVVVRESNLLL